MERIVSLDIIRILAIALVVVYHFVVHFKPIPFGGDLGSIGVTLFFILSGYTLRLTYKKSPGLKEYFFKRFLSIFPLLWICFAFFYIIQGRLLNNFTYGGNPLTVFQSILGFDGYLRLYKFENYYVIGEWFTGAILLLYLVFPLLNAMMDSEIFLYTVILLIFNNLALSYDLSPIPMDGKFLVSVFTMWTGMLLEWLERTHPLKKIWIIPLVALALFISSQHELVLIEQTRLILCLCIFLSILILFRNVHFSPILTRTLAFLSSATFAIYLTHHFILNTFFQLFPNLEPWSLFLLAVLTILVVSALLYLLSTIIIKDLKILFRREEK